MKLKLHPVSQDLLYVLFLCDIYIIPFYMRYILTFRNHFKLENEWELFQCPQRFKEFLDWLINDSVCIVTGLLPFSNNLAQTFCPCCVDPFLCFRSQTIFSLNRQCKSSQTTWSYLVNQTDRICSSNKHNQQIEYIRNTFVLHEILQKYCFSNSTEVH